MQNLSLKAKYSITPEEYIRLKRKKSSFIGWPSYEVDGKWKSNIYVDEDLNDEMDKLIEVIEKALEDME